MKIKLIADIEVSCSEPRAITRKIRTVKVVALGVPLDMDPEVIVEAADAVTGRRLKKKVNGLLVDTTCVLLEYEDSDKVSEYVYFMWRRFPLRPYHAEPIRCFVCQGFGHTSKNCVRKQPKCSKCAGEHTFSDCQNANSKCINCKGDHAATSRACPKYVEVKETLNLVNSERMSYKEALLKIRSKPASKEIANQEILKSAVQTTAVTQITSDTVTQMTSDVVVKNSNVSVFENPASEPEPVAIKETTDLNIVQQRNFVNQTNKK